MIISHEMQTVTKISAFLDLEVPLVLAVGTFDGVHLGHQKILECAREKAARLSGKAVVLTFQVHPLSIVAPERAPRLLSSESQKETLLAKFGVDYWLHLPFTPTVAGTEPEDFIKELMAALPHLAVICAGMGWHFGKGGKKGRGNMDLLKKLALECHFEVEEIGPVMLGGVPVSSTRIRRALSVAATSGSLQEVTACLGRPYALEGVVIEGAQLGRTLGVPTCNFDPQEMEGKQLPFPGVYSTEVLLDGVRYRSVTNIGRCPTITSRGEDQVQVETHLLDFAGNLYGKKIEIHFLSYLRPEQKFETIAALQAQLYHDIVVRRA